MRTAVDTSVLLAVFLDEPAAGSWVDLLAERRKEGELVCCEIVLAELAPLFATQAELESRMEDLGIRLEPCSAATAFAAGRLFARHRKAGGPRQHLIPDFLIGAHALTQADGLAAVDRGYLRRHFASLKLWTVPDAK